MKSFLFVYIQKCRLLLRLTKDLQNYKNIPTYSLSIDENDYFCGIFSI